MIRGGNIGAMDVLLLIESPVKTYSTVTNEQIKSWASFGSAWAEKLIDPKSSEGFEGDQQVARKVYVFRIRYQAGITEEMRVVRGSEISYIRGIEEVDRQEFLLLTTEKRDNDGQ